MRNNKIFAAVAGALLNAAALCPHGPRKLFCASLVDSGRSVPMRTIHPPQDPKPRRATYIALAILLTVLCPARSAAAQATETVLYEFGAPNSGGDPQGPLVFDAAGNLYGTTQSGGAYGWGTVFQLSPGPGGWTQTELYSFTSGKDGGGPYAGLAIDSAGNLYGTTVLGGDLGGVNCYVGGGCGTVFELTPGPNGKWTETVLYAFAGGRDGNAPEAAVTLDSLGNIYGTTTNGGSQTSYGYGTVFRLTNTAGAWKESVLHRFTGGTDGGYPVSSVTVDAAGNVYGTTAGGGNEACNPPHGCGLVFKLSPNANGSWRETALHSFLGGKDGSSPLAGLIFDAAGNLYGTTNAGGGAADCPDTLSPGCGMVFELSPAQSGWKETVLHAFTGGKDGGSPWAPLIWDAAGSLYGNTYIGGSNACDTFYSSCGVVFQLSPAKNGGWRETVLHAFTDGNDGADPVTGLTLDRAGNLYGATVAGGPKSGACPYGCGVVFEMTPLASK